MTLRVIVNADDLGVGSQVNDAIFELASRGTVTSATMLANGPDIDDALSVLSRFPKVSFGIHLNLTEFAPITRSEGLRPLLDSGGRFSPSAIRSVRIGANLRAAVFEEWSAQVMRLVNSGQAPSHFDSHHHVHTIPGLFPVLKRLQAQFGIRRVRLTKNVFAMSAPYTALHLAKKAAWNAALRTLYRTRTTAAFTSLAEFHDLYERNELDRWLRPNWTPGKTIEVMVHPGNAAFETENRILGSSWMHEQGFELLNYMGI